MLFLITLIPFSGVRFTALRSRCGCTSIRNHHLYVTLTISVSTKVLPSVLPLAPVSWSFAKSTFLYPWLFCCIPFWISMKSWWSAGNAKDHVISTLCIISVAYPTQKRFVLSSLDFGNLQASRYARWYHVVRHQNAPEKGPLHPWALLYRVHSCMSSSKTLLSFALSNRVSAILSHSRI